MTAGNSFGDWGGATFERVEETIRRPAVLVPANRGIDGVQGVGPVAMTQTARFEDGVLVPEARAEHGAPVEMLLALAGVRMNFDNRHIHCRKPLRMEAAARPGVGRCHTVPGKRSSNGFTVVALHGRQGRWAIEQITIRGITWRGAAKELFRARQQTLPAQWHGRSLSAGVHGLAAAGSW